MLNCSKFDVILKYRRESIPINEITSDVIVTPDQQEKARLMELGQVAPLTVIKNRKGTYSLLEGDQIYAAMADLLSQGNQQFAVADCLTVEHRGLDDWLCDLIIRYHPIEFGGKNVDAYRLDWVDALLVAAERRDMPQSQVTALVADLLNQSKRYARMYVTIAADAIPEVRQAVITPASGRREKSAHIPVEQAARIAGLSPEQQKAELAKLQAALTEKKTGSQTARQKSVQAWLFSVEKQLKNGIPLKKSDRDLLMQAYHLGEEFNSEAGN